MIRCDKQDDGNWQGFSGELVVATVARNEDEPDRWLWTITALKRPKGWRKGAGHRTTWIDARRAADEYWQKWLEAAALRPDIGRLAAQSVRERPKPRKRAAPRSG